MTPTPTSWGDVWLYDIVLDREGVEWKIVDEKNGWLKMRNRAGHEAQMLRPDDGAPVTAMRYTLDEAIATVHQVFPGSQIIEITDERTPTR